MADQLVEPIAGPQPAVEITPTEPQPEATASGPELPDNVLKIPQMGPLLAGSPAALSTKIKTLDETEEGKIIAENFKALQGAGIFAYRALDRETGVLGNSLYISPEAIKQADAAGQLASVAPDWNMVGSEAARAGAANPVITATGVPTAPAPAPVPTPPQQSSGLLPQPPASTQTSLARSRTKNLQPGSPTSGPAPGRGRLLNNLLKPAI